MTIKPPILKADSLSIAYNSKTIIEDLSLSFAEPQIVSIIGPNGSGKSTILKALGRILKPKMGVVFLDGKDIHSMPAKKIAQIMSILPQSPHTPEDITVYDLVSYGRHPYHSFFKGSKDDKEIIDWAIRETHLEDLVFRPVNTLSGGERQRAWIAMSLAQKPQIMLLDEPTTFLDIRHQIEIMELLKRLHERLEIIVIMVIHDLNHAIRYSRRIIAVKDGKVFKDGPPREVITEDTMSEVFGIKAKIVNYFPDGGIICIPCGVC